MFNDSAKGTRNLDDVRLYVLIDGRDSTQDFERLARGLVAAGVGALQLRDKTLTDRQLLDRARRLRKITAGSPTLFIMNDRADLAVLASADGVHVGQDELTAQGARAVVGPDCLVGVSTHDLAQAEAAQSDGADYIGVGPTFPSTTKQFDHFPGLALLRQVAQQIGLPAFAIGGVAAENLADVLATGIHGVAVGAAVVQSPDPRREAEKLLDLIAGVNPTTAAR